jgi:hypothetical protein
MTKWQRSLHRLAHRHRCDLEKTRGGHWRITTEAGDIVIASSSPRRRDGYLVSLERQLRKLCNLEEET